MNERSHSVDLLFVLCLFFVFTISSVAVVLIGSKVYSKTVDNMETAHNNDTAMNYLIEKVRLHNDGSVKLIQSGNTDVLCLTETNGTNYLYAKNHGLYEYTSSGSFNATKGHKVMSLTSLTFSEKNNLLTIKLTLDHKTSTSYINLVRRNA
jgi:hypothetical protein